MVSDGYSLLVFKVKYYHQRSILFSFINDLLTELLKGEERYVALW